MIQDAFHRVVKPRVPFELAGPGPRASSFRGILRDAFASICPQELPPSASVSSRIRSDDFLQARSCGSWLRLATGHAARSRCVRPIFATQHSVNEHPYSSAPGFIIRGSSVSRCPVCTRWVAPIETEDSRVSRRPNRFGESQGPCGGFLRPTHGFPFFTGDLPLTPLSPPSLRGEPALRDFALGESRQDRFHFVRRDAERSSPRSEVPSFGMWAPDSLRPFDRRPRDHLQARDFAHHDPGYRRWLTLGLPRSACGAARSPLVSPWHGIFGMRDRRLARISSVG